MGKAASGFLTVLSALFPIASTSRSRTQRRKRRMRFWRCGFALLFLTAAPLLAQSERATLRGTVTDSSGAVVPGAEFVVTEVATNIESRQFATDGHGNY